LGQSATTQGRGNRRAARDETGLFDMGSFSIWHWLVVAVIVMLMFGGRGRISEIMGDVARGIRSFRKGLSEDDKNLESTNKDQTEKKN
jgi:TatA/E family protein of Tat protein translocase